MRASAWNNGASTYGISVGRRNRDEFFDREWQEIEVEIDGKFHRFRITGGFWNQCPEIRDNSRKVIRDWLRRHFTIPWSKREPPEVDLTHLGDNRFRLSPLPISTE